MNKTNKLVLECIVCAAIIIGLPVVIHYVSQKYINVSNDAVQQPMNPHQ